ncbi:coagulation factor X [Sinocyclocheilus anshuiensis]|uniref:coagulation factor Xa n=1 Tax=Sinocyclocheilus anshuiensis TaxID=1608454 RepID=A0A671KLS3_9TELE|nr:PREDICTED: coagulation factor X-like [Sinocyclocheilus anshuiensis]
MSWVFWNFLFLFLIHCVNSEVFLHTQDASQVLSRRRRANTMFEEVKKGNMERECVEERCSYEEAREIFEDVKKTDEFWHVYVDGDACLSHPCLNGGECKDTIGPYTCFCQQGFKGYNCEIVIPALCESENGGCDHFCRIQQNNIACSCAKGYQLASNGKSCLSHDPFKCGTVHPQKTRSILNNIQINNTENEEETHVETTVEPVIDFTNPPSNETKGMFGLLEQEIMNPVEEQPVLPESSEGDTRIVNGMNCLPGDCPWQALLINEDNIGFCGGTILNEYFVLSAAHCMNQSLSTRVVVGEFDTLVNESQEVTHDVDKILIHKNYMADTYHNDIALIKLSKPIKFTKFIIPACLPEREFAERILMRREDGMVSGFGRVREGGLQSTILQKLTVPYIDRAKCIESSKFKISSRMFCAGYDQEEKDACQGDSGGPHVTRYKNTWFVTGVVSWGEGCAQKGKYGVYTQVSKYIMWIHNAMSKVMPQMEASIKPRAKRELLQKTPVRRV